MKKITLLLVATVFVIGIQSCSTEDNVFEEETQGLPENVVSADELLGRELDGAKFGQTIRYVKAYVVYGESLEYSDRIGVLEYFRDHVFSEVFALTIDNGCQDVDTWYVPCHEVPGDKGCGKPDAVEIKVEDTDGGGEGQLAIGYEYSFISIPASTDCSDL